MTSQGKARKMQGDFALRVKIGEHEVELKGVREDVLKAIDDLPRLIGCVHKAFEAVKPKTVATLTVKTEPVKDEKPAQKFPKIVQTQSCEEAVVRVLQTDWGKWRPRTLEELKEALQANGLSHSGRVLAGVLLRLVKKARVRRWNTDAGFVYILAEAEAVASRSEGE